MSQREEKKASIGSHWEWVAAGVSAVIVLGTLIMLATGAVQDHAPPEISARVDNVVTLAEGYLARITVSNDGTETAADLVIEGELYDATGVLETSTVTLDYVPGSGQRAAGLFFRVDPRTGRLRIRPLGYRAP